MSQPKPNMLVPTPLVATSNTIESLKRAINSLDNQDKVKLIRTLTFENMPRSAYNETKQTLKVPPMVSQLYPMRKKFLVQPLEMKGDDLCVQFNPNVTPAISCKRIPSLITNGGMVVPIGHTRYYFTPTTAVFLRDKITTTGTTVYSNMTYQEWKANSAGDAYWFCCECESMNPILQSFCGACDVDVHDHSIKYLFTLGFTAYPGFGTPTKAKQQKKVKEALKKDVKVLKSVKPSKPKSIKKVTVRDIVKVKNSKALQSFHRSPEHTSYEARPYDPKVVELALRMMRVRPDEPSVPFRLPDLAQNVPSAVAALSSDYSITLNSSGVLPVSVNQNVFFLSKQALLASVALEPNPTAAMVSYVGYGITDEAPNTQLGLTWGTTTYPDGTWVNVMPEYWAPDGYCIQPFHGSAQYAIGLNGAIWIDANSTINLNMSNSTGASTYNYRYTLVKPGARGATEFVISDNFTGDFGTYSSFPIVTEGYYFIEVQTSDNDQYLTINSIQKQSSSWVWAHRCAPALEKIIDSVTDIRATLAACELSNMTAEMYKGGMVVANQVRSGVDPAIYRNGDVFTLVSKSALSSKAQSAADGMYVPYKDASDKDILWPECLINNPVYGTQSARADFLWEDNYIVMVTQIQPGVSSPTQQAIFRVFINVEFQTDSQFFLLRNPTYTVEQFNQARHLVARTHNYYTNTWHMSEIFDSVKNFLSKAVHKTADFLPMVGKFVEKAAPIAATVASMI